MHLGDRVEFSCVAPESKPPAILDWIINDSLNLSTPQTTSRLDASSSTRWHARLASPSSNAVTWYELKKADEKSDRRLRVDGPDVSGERLSQLAIMSSSRLNLTADGNLLRALGFINTTFGSPENRQAMNFSLPSSPTRPSSVVSSRRMGKSQRRGDSILLRVKCVARVLHLSLSDEIKLRLISGTTAIETDPGKSRTLKSPKQTDTAEGESATSDPSLVYLT